MNLWTMFRTILYSLLLTSLVSAQNYRWPIRASQSLSATFCEYRSGHLHAGIDIKTWGEMEVPCYAISDGYIERIIIGYNGYGRGVFIQLGDGNVAVYGHLELFTPEIEKLISAQQIENDRYSQRLRFTPDQYPVRVGQVIGYSGTSGTEHPHLHFEIRDSLNHALNPQLFYEGIEDTKSPVLDEILLIPSEPSSRINGSHQAIISSFQADDEPVAISGPFQVAINAHDRADGTFNKYNVYEASTYANDSLSFVRRFDEVPMKWSDHIDLIYPGIRGKRGWRFMAMYSAPTDSLKLFAPDSLTGIIQPKGLSVLKVKVTDVKDNQAVKQILYRHQELASWTVTHANRNVIITRHYSQNGYERFQFYSEDNKFLPVSETLYRLHSTTWVINEFLPEKGIRALGALGGEIKWVIPPPSQSIPEIEYHWISQDSGFYLKLESTEPYIFPVAYTLNGSDIDLSGELTQTSSRTAETNIIPLYERARSHTVHLISGKERLLTIPLIPWNPVSAQDSLVLKLPGTGYTLVTKNSGGTDFFIYFDTLSSKYNGKSVTGASLSLLGANRNDFSATLMAKPANGDLKYSIFSPGKKKTWKLENSVDSLGLVQLPLSRAGSFFLLLDSSPPSVKAQKAYKRVKQGSRMVFKVSDNSGRIPRPAKSILASLDGEKFFPDYNPLRKEISFHAPTVRQATMHAFQLTVSDESGNIGRFSHQFSVTR